MRSNVTAFVLVLVGLCGCGGQAPGDSCKTPNEVSCGSEGARDNLMLICKGGSYLSAGGCPGGLKCSTSSLGDDELHCGSGLGKYCIAVEGELCGQSGDTSFCCSSAVPEHRIKCIGGVWTVDVTCSSGKICGSSATFTVGCI